jgi:hypothetical protein
MKHYLIHGTNAYMYWNTSLKQGGSVVVVVQNESEVDKELLIKVGNQTLNPLLKANSFNTFLIND